MADCNVAESVRSIVSAFTNGLAIFSKIRERRRQKRANKQKAGSGAMSHDELRLSTSLRRGSRDVQKHYEKNYGTFGETFAKGDAAAHSSLAEILIKLNSGLVRIISSFLSRDKENFGYDCKSLTALSNASRLETLDALGQLYTRLANSTDLLSCCGSCATPSREHGSRASSRKPPTSRTPSPPKKSQRRRTTETITRLPVDGSSQSQLVMVRPRNRRGTSSSSVSSSRTARSSPSSSTVTSPSIAPLALPGLEEPRARAKSHPKHSDVTKRPQTWPNRAPLHEKPVPLLPKAVTWSEQEQVHDQLGELRAQPIVRRRRVDTPSTYSFASDSTKLGEIPMHKWTTPVDLEEMERLNLLAEQMAGVAVEEPRTGGEGSKERKRGFWNRFKGKARAG